MIKFAAKTNFRSILTLGVIAGLSACPTTTLPTGTWPVLYQVRESPEYRSDVAEAVVLAPNGDLIAAGRSYHVTDVIPSSSDAVALRVDPTGSIIWSKILGVENYSASFVDVTAASDGGFVFAGERTLDDDPNDPRRYNLAAWVVALDGDGNERWSLTHTEGTYGIALEAHSLDTGETLVIVRSEGQNYGDNRWYVMNISNEGTLKSVSFLELSVDARWAEFSISNSAIVAAARMIVPNEDPLIENDTVRDIWIGAYDLSGEPQWTQTVDVGDFESVSDLLITADGGVVATGTDRGSLFYTPSFTFKLDASGQFEWSAPIGGWEVGESPGSGFLVAGPLGIFDTELSRLTGNGSVDWSRAYQSYRPHDLLALPAEEYMVVGGILLQVGYPIISGCLLCDEDLFLLRIDEDGLIVE